MLHAVWLKFQCRFGIPFASHLCSTMSMEKEKDLPKDSTLTSPEFLSGLGGVEWIVSDLLSQLEKNQPLDGHEVGLSEGTRGLGHQSRRRTSQDFK